MEKIEDFGIKIGGARKDSYLRYVETYALITQEALIAQPLTKVFKLPNLSELWSKKEITTEQARMCLYLWNKIAKKPLYKIQSWAENTYTIIQELTNILLLKRQSLEGLFDNFDEASLQDIFFKEMEAANWPEEKYNRGKYSVGYSILYPQRPYTIVTNNRPIERHYNIEQALSRLRELTQSVTKSKNNVQFKIYKFKKNNEYVICPAGKKNIYLRRGIFNRSEVIRVLNEEKEALQAEYDRLRKFPNERREVNSPRIGQDYRNNIDMTPDNFSKLIPFRGVEFGNWLNQSERLSHLNECSDALRDMASVLGISLDKIAHDGTLAMAFGSRGISKFAAHYELEKRVINLTKKSGAGCLAHEWFHSLDNYLMIRESQPLLHSISDNTRLKDETIKKAAIDLYRIINLSQYAKRSHLLDAYKSKKYWGTMIELSARAFEAFLYYKMQAQGISNDYLVNFLSYNEYSRKECYPYPTEEENKTFAPFYDTFLKAVYTNN